MSAAQDFYRDTGQKLRISSAYRSREKQEELWNNRANNRYPVAPPGTSSHERGQAVDILNFQTAERYLKQQGLYRPDPVGDPIHFGYGAGDANGVSGPASGYRPTLNSNASVSNTNNNTAPAQNNADNSILTEQLNKLDRIMQATERQAQLAQQMLSYAS
jgi:D-alanyl-D-alanine dipeptidase